MDLVDIVLPPFLGNEEHPFEEEQRTGVLRPQDMKGALQHQLSIGGQVRTLPVDQKRLYLLRMHSKESTPPHTSQLRSFGMKGIRMSTICKLIFGIHIQYLYKEKEEGEAATESVIQTKELIKKP